MLLAVILAGGRGTRLGRPSKPLATLGGKPLLRHVIERIAPQADRVVINTGRPLPGLEDLPFAIVDDVPGGEHLPGLFRGLRTALTHIGDPSSGVRHLLTAPTDTPFLPRGLARALTAAAGDSDVAFAADGSRVHPSIALWSRAAADRALAALAAYHEESLQGFLRRQGGVAVPVELASDESFLNVNTERDLREAERFLSRNLT